MMNRPVTMPPNPHELMEQGRIRPLDYYFGRFVARGSGAAEDGLLAYTATLLSMRTGHGDVCVDLSHYVHCCRVQPGGEERRNGAPRQGEDAAGFVVPGWNTLEEWRSGLASAAWVGSPADPRPPLVLDGNRLYLQKYWCFEHTVAAALTKRLVEADDIDYGCLKAGLSRLFPDAEGAEGVDWQKAAAAIALLRRFAVISGGPGTGKTTTVVKVLALLLEQDPGLRIALAAPTGKAAAQLSASIAKGKGAIDPAVRGLIPDSAATIHRLLRPYRGRFRHDQDNPLLIDCLILDEASMIDLPLMAKLLDALPAHTRILLLGDRDQLASVEAGSVLADITGGGREIAPGPQLSASLEELGVVGPGDLPVAAESTPIADAVALLRVSYRFDQASGIGALARAVNAGEGSTARGLFASSRYADLGWLEAQGEQPDGRCLDWMVRHYQGYLAQADVGTALRRFDHTRVLCALRNGPFGVERLNTRLEEALRRRGFIDGGEVYRGRPIMISRNDYEVELFNGDIGLLWPDNNGRMQAWFPSAGAGGGKAALPRAVPLSRLPEFVTAYCLTVHKSQGSEFDAVLLVLPVEDTPVLTRELIYTGVTRAKGTLTVYATAAAFVAGCGRRVERSSGLGERLGW